MSWAWRGSVPALRMQTFDVDHSGKDVRELVAAVATTVPGDR